jgi:IclR family acetate operon transcriptional repressor
MNLEQNDKRPKVDADRYIVHSVDHAIELLFILESTAHDMGVTELSRLLGIQKSTTHNLLRTLLARDFVRQTDLGRYALGFRLMPLGLACTEQLDIRRIAYPVLNDLVKESNEVVLFAVLSNNQLTVIERKEPARTVFVMPCFNYFNTFHSTSLGKVFLAFGPDELYQKVMSNPLIQYTPNTILDKQILVQEIDHIRKQGYAVSCDETFVGVTCVSAPIINANGKIEGAISISGSSNCLGREVNPTIIALLKQKAKEISKRLGYRSCI